MSLHSSTSLLSPSSSHLWCSQLTFKHGSPEMIRFTGLGIMRLILPSRDPLRLCRRGLTLLLDTHFNTPEGLATIQTSRWSLCLLKASFPQYISSSENAPAEVALSMPKFSPRGHGRSQTRLDAARHSWLFVPDLKPSGCNALPQEVVFVFTLSLPTRRLQAQSTGMTFPAVHPTSDGIAHSHLQEESSDTNGMWKLQEHQFFGLYHEDVFG